MARDQALGRLGLVWRRLKQFYSDVMLLSVDCFRKNRPEDAEIPILGPGGEFESRWIRLADLKGNIQAYPESDETFPRLKSQQRSVVQQLMASSDPLIQQALADPANVGFVKSVLGLSDLVVPGEDSRNKQLREIELLMHSAPIAIAATVGHRQSSTQRAREKQNLGQKAVLPSVPVDLLFDNHAVELEECRRWANSDAGANCAHRKSRGLCECARTRRRICARLGWRMPIQRCCVLREFSGHVRIEAKTHRMKPVILELSMSNGAQVELDWTRPDFAE